jgi:ATPase subunit of ABC transporter with duplicated ATPase domains
MPSTLLDARRISRRFGAHEILESVDFRLADDERVALVGPNGSGKSTLLRILAGIEPSSGGEVQRRGIVGYLPQVVPHSEAAATARELILERIGVAPAGRELDRLAAALEAGDLEALDAHAEALERWVALGGSDAEARVRAAATGLGLDAEELDRPLRSLSGGQAARVGLAALGASRFDALLLDEPTNHLDENGLERLRQAIASRGGGIVVVSHDRAFLADVATRVVELDLHGAAATVYAGGWDAYEREREMARRTARDEYERATAERARVHAAATEHRRRAAVSASHAKHAARDGDKHAKEWILSRADGMRARAARIAHRAEMVEVPEKPREDPRLRLELTAAERRGRWVIALEGAVLERGPWRLGPIDLALAHGDRMLLRGPNGSGKSSLLGALTGELPLRAGRRRVARGAMVALLGQDREALATAAPLADAFRALTGLGAADARTALASFGLGANAALRSADTLSPGERTRAELAALAQRRATCLLLDEPTNHLDTDALEVVEAALRGWPGALVVATHDLRLREALELERERAL